MKWSEMSIKEQNNLLKTILGRSKRDYEKSDKSKEKEKIENLDKLLDKL